MTESPMSALIEAVKQIQAGDADAALAMACAISEGSVSLQDIVQAVHAAKGH